MAVEKEKNIPAASNTGSFFMGAPLFLFGSFGF
jgi:hypothetical protein